MENITKILNNLGDKYEYSLEYKGILLGLAVKIKPPEGISQEAKQTWYKEFNLRKIEKNVVMAFRKSIAAIEVFGSNFEEKLLDIDDYRKIADWFVENSVEVKII